MTGYIAHFIIKILDTEGKLVESGKISVYGDFFIVEEKFQDKLWNFFSYIIGHFKDGEFIIDPIKRTRCNGYIIQARNIASTDPSYAQYKYDATDNVLVWDHYKTLTEEWYNDIRETIK